MRTKTRLFLSLGTLTLLVFVLALGSIASIRQLRGEGADVLRANYVSLAYMQDMLAVMNAGSTTALPRLKELVARQEQNITEEGEAAATKDLAMALAAWEKNAQDSLSSKELISRIRIILDLNRDAIIKKAQLAEERGDRAATWVTLGATLCALIALSMLFGMAEFLIAPIRALTTGIDRIAQGNYRERIILDRKDEFGHLAERFNAMAAELEKWENSNLARIMEEKARAEAVIQSLQDASIGFDEQGVILFANQHALDLLNITAGDLVGRQRADVERTNDLLREVLSATHQGPLKIVMNGREQFFSLEHVPILKSGQRLGTVAVVRNITPFEEKDRAKTHFLATISHELKTPLASTDIGLALLERQANGSLSTGQVEILADLRKDHQRLVRIVSELLDLAQAETGNIRLQLADVAVDRSVTQALEAVKMAAQEKAIRFDLQLPQERILMKADPDKMVWVLVNLLTNAVRHSPHGGTIGVRAAQEDRHVAIEISDEGEGIPPAEQDRVFQRFTPGHKGSGLGLSIAKEFMEAMGGTIIFDRTRQKGASFTARSPRS